MEEKAPLENRVVYNYEAQAEANYEGTSGRVTATGRVLDDGSSQVIRRRYDAAGQLIEETSARGYAPFVPVELGNLARLAGDEPTRQCELREAHRLFTEMGATARAEQVARELGSSAESTSRISSTGRT